MELPENLRAALEEQLRGTPQSELLTAAENISGRYRKRQASKPYIQSRDEALAYALARMPATFGAVSRALTYALEGLREPFSAPLSLLDVGAGTGAASWAAGELLPLRSVHCLEYADVMRRVGEAMMHRESSPLQSAVWERFDLRSDSIGQRADVVIASYVLNELGETAQLLAAEQLWQAADGMLLLVEPGTPEGYRVLMRIRQRLLERGAHLLAPCPRETPCPLSGDDWCHFSCRIPRTRLHKLAKGGDAPFEDEKYAYLAFSREESRPAASRILRRPYIGKGYVRLELCTGEGLAQKTLTKRDGPLYKAARKASCGDGGASPLFNSRLDASCVSMSENNTFCVAEEESRDISEGNSR